MAHLCGGEMEDELRGASGLSLQPLPRFVALGEWVVLGP